MSLYRSHVGPEAGLSRATRRNVRTDPLSIESGG